MILHYEAALNIVRYTEARKVIVRGQEEGEMRLMGTEFLHGKMKSF